MASLMNHAWLTGTLIICLNIVFGRFRMRAMIANGALTEVEANRFCLNAAVVVIVLCGLFEILTLRTGVPLLCQPLLPLTDRRLLPTYALTLLCGAVFLFWVWKRGGDRTLAKVAPAFTRGGRADTRYTPEQVRFWCTAFLVVAWVGYVVMRAVLPLPAQTHLPFCPHGIEAEQPDAARP